MVEKSDIDLKPAEALPDILNSAEPLSLSVLIDRYENGDGFQPAHGHLCRKGKDGSEEVLANICSVSPPCFSIGIHYQISPWSTELSIEKRTVFFVAHYLGEDSSGWFSAVLSGKGGQYGT